MKICILGAGSWGTALSILLAGNGHDVTVWSIDPEEVLMLKNYREHVRWVSACKELST